MHDQIKGAIKATFACVAIVTTVATAMHFYSQAVKKNKTVIQAVESFATSKP